MTLHRNFDTMESEEAFTPREEGKNYLFAVGIDTYKNFPGMGLENCVNDAKDFISVLTEEYQFEREDTILLTNESAGKDQINQKLDGLLEKLEASDTLIVFFACHGKYISSTQTGYFFPFDGKTQQSTWINHSDINSRICGSKAHHVFLVVDACFGGSLFRSFSDEEQIHEKTYALRVDCFASRFALAAGRIEKVLDGRPGHNSPFTQSVVQFLRNNPYDIFAVSMLIYHITRVVPDKTSQTPIGGKLSTDKSIKQEGGEFVFRRKNPYKNPAFEKKTAKVFALHKIINRKQQLQKLRPLRRVSRDKVRIALIPACLEDKPENLIEHFVKEQFDSNVHWILDTEATPPQLIPLSITDSLNSYEDFCYEMLDYWQVEDQQISTGEGVLEKFEGDKKPLIFPLRLEQWGPHTVSLIDKVMKEFWGSIPTYGREVYVFVSVIFPSKEISSPKSFWKKSKKKHPDKKALLKFKEFCSDLNKTYCERVREVPQLTPIPTEEIKDFIQKYNRKFPHKGKYIAFMDYLEECEKQKKMALTMFEIENWVIKHVS